MTAGTPSVGVVVVNYKRHDLLRSCLESLAASTLRPQHVVVVDNASDATALEDAVGAMPEVTRLMNAGNPGYAASCNQGWRALGTDLVLFLNADVTLAPECLERAVAAMADPGVAIATARLVRPDGGLDHACHRGTPTPSAALWYSLRLHRLRPASRRFAAYTMSWQDLATEHDVEACSGAFLLIRAATLKAVRGWDEGYWFYAEDLDLCLRVRQAGQRVRYVPEAVATHVKGASRHLGSAARTLNPEEQRNLDQVRMAIVESHRRFFRLHLAPRTAWPVRRLVEARFSIERAVVHRSIRRSGHRTPGGSEPADTGRP